MAVLFEVVGACEREAAVVGHALAEAESPEVAELQTEVARLLVLLESRDGAVRALTAELYEARMQLGKSLEMYDDLIEMRRQ